MIRTSRTTASIRASMCTWSAPSLTLLKDGERIAGASATTGSAGFRLFRAKAIVLATGGIGRA